MNPAITVRFRSWQYLMLVAVAALFWTRTALPQELVHWHDTSKAVKVQLASSGHFLVPAIINGKAAGWFLFDSGAGGNALDRQLAEEWNLPIVGSGWYQGIGPNLTPYEECQAERLQVGPLEIQQAKFMSLDLGLLGQRLGTRVAGILGYDVFFEAVVEVHYEPPAIQLHPPRSFQLTDGEWQGMLLFRRTPFVRANYEENQGLFRIDLGAPQDTVTFHVEAAKPLLATRQTTPEQFLGSFGKQTVQAGHLRSFELAGVLFERPRVHFATAADGAFAESHTTGNLGGLFLREFRIFLDYRNARVSLQPRTSAPRGGK